MNWLSKLWSLFKSFFIPCVQSAADAAEEAGAIRPETAEEIKEVLEGIDALETIVSRSLELIGGGLPENSLLKEPEEEDAGSIKLEERDPVLHSTDDQQLQQPVDATTTEPGETAGTDPGPGASPGESQQPTSVEPNP